MKGRPRRVIVGADDFGLSLEVNEAVERAHREGILTSASLMVAGEAAADAVRRSLAMPGLDVGLHLVAVEGPGITRDFPSNQLRLGLEFARHPGRLALEIRAQVEAFVATGLPLVHADAHKHMHLHPVVGRLLLEVGREYGLRAIRVPAEPPGLVGGGAGGHALYCWTRILRHQAVRAGVFVNDAAFGIAWSGHMTADRVRGLVPRLPGGVSEMYFHPASRHDARLEHLMPGYEHEAELATLVDPGLAASFAPGTLTSYRDLA